MSINTITPAIITNFSGHHPTVERADEFDKRLYSDARVVILTYSILWCRSAKGLRRVKGSARVGDRFLSLIGRQTGLYKAATCSRVVTKTVAPMARHLTARAASSPQWRS